MEEVNDNSEFVIPLRWKTMSFSEERRPDLHRRRLRSVHDREKIEGAQVYRWLFRNADSQIEKVYIGESSSFSGRLSAYRSAGKRENTTEQLLRELIRGCEAAGGSVDLELLALQSPFKINGVVVNTYALGNMEVRRMLENLAIMSAKANGLKVVNRVGGNIILKKFRGLVRQIAGRHNNPAMVEDADRVIAEGYFYD